MSATVDTALLSKYFGEVPIIEIPGRTFPVEQIFLEDLLQKMHYKAEIGSDSLSSNVERFNNWTAENTLPDTSIADDKLNLPQLRLRYKGKICLCRRALQGRSNSQKSLNFFPETPMK